MAQIPKDKSKPQGLIFYESGDLKEFDIKISEKIAQKLDTLEKILNSIPKEIEKRFFPDKYHIGEVRSLHRGLETTPDNLLEVMCEFYNKFPLNLKLLNHYINLEINIDERSNNIIFDYKDVKYSFYYYDLSKIKS